MPAQWHFLVSISQSQLNLCRFNSLRNTGPTSFHQLVWQVLDRNLPGPRCFLVMLLQFVSHPHVFTGLGCQPRTKPPTWGNRDHPQSGPSPKKTALRVLVTQVSEPHQGSDPSWRIPTLKLAKQTTQDENSSFQSKKLVKVTMRLSLRRYFYWRCSWVSLSWKLYTTERII